MNIKDTEKTLKALANRRRLAILSYLEKEGSASVGNIAEHIRLSFKATSKHLTKLHSADILDRNQTDLTVMYFLSKPLHPLTKITLSIL